MARGSHVFRYMTLYSALSSSCVLSAAIHLLFHLVCIHWQWRSCWPAVSGEVASARCRPDPWASLGLSWPRELQRHHLLLLTEPADIGVCFLLV